LVSDLIILLKPKNKSSRVWRR